MSDIYDLMAEEARQSFFQLESVTSALDSKAFGVMTADALLFSAFAYVGTPLSNAYFYIPIIEVTLSVVFLLASVSPRRFHRQFSDDTIRNYGTWEPERALAQIAANYADLERDHYRIYENKFKWFLAGIILMVVAMATEIAVFAFFTFDP